MRQRRYTKWAGHYPPGTRRVRVSLGRTLVSIWGRFLSKRFLLNVRVKSCKCLILWRLIFNWWCFDRWQVSHRQTCITFRGARGSMSDLIIRADDFPERTQCSCKLGSGGGFNPRNLKPREARDQKGSHTPKGDPLISARPFARALR